MAEWSKAHAWKVCIRHKRIEGSNPFLSANAFVHEKICQSLLQQIFEWTNDRCEADVLRNALPAWFFGINAVNPFSKFLNGQMTDAKQMY